MKTIIYKEHNINIFNDDTPETPREWDNLTKMICFHRRYELGDKHDYNNENYSNWNELKNAIVKNENPIIILPLYLYDHSGITISTTPFSCGWDSGQIGFIYISQTEVDLLGCTINENESKSDYKKRLKSSLLREVKTYDNYITGEVYGYQIEGNLCEDSCWGFYGDYEKSGLLDEAKSSIDYAVQQSIEKKVLQTKSYIKNEIPLIYRS